MENTNSIKKVYAPVEIVVEDYTHVVPIKFFSSYEKAEEFVHIRFNKYCAGTILMTEDESMMFDDCACDCPYRDGDTCEDCEMGRFRHCDDPSKACHCREEASKYYKDHDRALEKDKEARENRKMIVVEYNVN